MPVHICQTKSAVKLADATRLPMKDITPDAVIESRYVQGKVKLSLGLSRQQNSCTLKLVLLDDDDSTIDVFAFDTVAEALSVCNSGDTLFLTGFMVEKSTRISSSSQHPCIIILVEEEGSPVLSVWVLKSKTPATSTKKRPVPEVTYTPLKQVKAGAVVNVFGVVKFFKPARKTRGLDYSLFLSLVDPSLYENEAKLKCMLFMKDEASLPSINIGDVLRIHRLKIGVHGEELQGTSHPGLAWLLFPAASPSSPVASSRNFTLTDSDKTKVRELFTWAKERGLSEEHSSATVRLQDVGINTYFNLICQVVSTAVVEQDVSFLVRVWDGTKPLHPIAAVEVEETRIVQSEELAARAEGLVLDVCLYEDHCQTATSIKPGDVIRLTNLRAGQHKGSKEGASVALPMLELCLHHGTSFGRGVTVLPPTSKEAVDLLTSLEKLRPPLSSSEETQNTPSQESATTALEAARNTTSETTQNTSGAARNTTSERARNTSGAARNTTSERAQNTSGAARSTTSETAQNTSETARNTTSERARNTTSETARNTTSERARNTSETARNTTSERARNTSLEAAGNTTDEAAQNTPSQARRKSPTKRAHPDTSPAADHGSSPRKMRLRSQAPKPVGRHLEVADSNANNPRPAAAQPEKQTRSSHRPASRWQQLRDQQDMEEEAMELSQPTASAEGRDQTQSDSNPPRCMLSTATVITEPRPHIPFSSLREVLEHQVPHKFKVQARVFDYHPQPAQPSSLLHLFCPACQYMCKMKSDGEKIQRQAADDAERISQSQHELSELMEMAMADQSTEESQSGETTPQLCPPCLERGVHRELRCVYLLKVVLQDGDSWLMAYVWKEHAVKFLKGIAPDEVLSKKRALEAVQDCLDQICPPNSQLPQRPWLECCLFSYTGQAGTRFQIFDTAVA